MKWKPIARQVTNRLYQHGNLDESHQYTALELIQNDHASKAFRYVSKIQNGKIKIGWNKIWRGRDLAIWVGRTAFTQPLRLIAMEIESVTQSNSKLRTYLSDKFQVSNKIVDDQAEQILCIYGLSSVSQSISQSQLKLLQRLNTDQRELPVIERWRWSDNCGIAYFSDGGQAQVTLELAWSRALENSLNNQNRFSELMIKFLSRIEPNQIVITLPTSLDEGLIGCLNMLQFYGLGQRLGDTFQLKVPVGNFPMKFCMLVDEYFTDGEEIR